MPVYEGDNAAKAFVNLIREEGYDVEYTGSLTSGFYLSHIVGPLRQKNQRMRQRNWILPVQHLSRIWRKTSGSDV